MKSELLSIHFPGKLVFGNGVLAGLEAEIAALDCARIYLLTVPALLPQIEGLVRNLEQQGQSVHLNTSILQEPTFADFEGLMQEAAPLNPDVVVGIGGGSVLDAAKLVAAQLENSQSLQEIVGIGQLKGRRKKLVCVPTTAGTGSEASPNAILVDNADNQKKGIISPFLVPDIVYVDPLLTASVPPQVTAATGLDALTHCLEAYTNKFAHPYIDMYAFEGMRLIAANLAQAVANGADKDARSAVAMGSLLGGFCLGPVNTAAVHALSYPLGSTFHLAHGLSNALLLPFVMEFNVPAAPRRYADVAVALGCPRGADDGETACNGIKKVQELIRQCGIPARLSEVGIPREAIPQMATDALKIQRLLKNNPREVTYADAVAIYEAAF
ncbi:iron-containing alcohol dehydrogenase [Paraflavisolibacter sp. H34]|uniref:iron-containing alcohol dehydrogenase n=1 Tax=Huijunlia imazamoxiresistens TaxID=3127457 RepID=UPI00301983FC